MKMTFGDDPLVILVNCSSQTILQWKQWVVVELIKLEQYLVRFILKLTQLKTFNCSLISNINQPWDNFIVDPTAASYDRRKKKNLSVYMNNWYISKL